MANDSYGSVSRCRVFVDYISYAKMQGMIDSFSYSTGRVSSNNPEALWDMNPSNVAEFTIIAQSGGQAAYTAGDFLAQFKYAGDDTAGLQFRNLISTTNYGALLGHNIGLLDPERSVLSKVRYGYASHTPIVGHNTCSNNIGYNIWKINHFVGYAAGENPLIDLTFFDMLGFEVEKGITGLYWSVGDVIRMGAFSTGRYFDFPYSPELDLSISYVHDGVKTIRTAGGSDLRDFNYPKPKKWGDLAPWTHIDLSEYENPSDALDYEDYSSAGRTGKRVFKIKYSYLDKTDMFPKNFEGNMSGNYGTQEVLGENLIENGAFDSVPGWATTSGQSVVTGGVGTFLGNGGYGQMKNVGVVMEIGEQYKLKLKCTSNSDTDDGRVNVNQVTVFPNIVPSGETGDFITYFECTDTTDFILYNPVYNDVISIDDVELYKVITRAGNWFDSNEGTHTDNIVGNFLTFTMGGQIPFIFQPDNTKQEFAICKLDKPSLNINQEANGVYSASMTFREL